MSLAKAPATLFLAAILAALAASPVRAESPSPAWAIQSTASPTNFRLGDESTEDTYLVFITNSGGAATDGSPIEIADTLPAGLSVKQSKLYGPRGGVSLDACQEGASGESVTVSCQVNEAVDPVSEPAKLYPGNQLILSIEVAAPSTPGALVNRVEVEGGGASASSWEAQNQASEEDARAGFEDFRAELIGADGRPARGADSHPYAYATSFAVNTVPTEPGSSASRLPAGGGLKEVEVALPPGLAGNPTAIQRCTVQQFMTVHGAASPLNVNSLPNECPAGSAVGLAAVQQLEGARIQILTPIYNLVPPKGMPAQFGFEVVGLPVYINTKVRSGSDYGITAYLSEVTEAERVTASRITIWGSPWDESHDTMRAQCAELEGTCPVEGTPRPFLRLPSSCASPLGTTMSFETWAQPPAFAQSSAGEPAPTECEWPDFSPTIEARPTTNVADAPSGLHVDVHLPQAQNEDPEGLGEADLREARVALPEGLLVNPSSANGLEGCSTSEIGLTTPVGQPDAHFSTETPTCPDASKLGTVEVDTPLVDHPLPGAVYLALPHENPFGSLLAIYIVVDDPQTGVVVKLAGHVEADPNTGQLTATVSESPQLPFEDFKLDFFEGARAPLRTPAFCATHTTKATFVPWTAPQGSTAFPTSSFDVTTPAAGQGSSCPGSPSSEPNYPAYEAGTATPVAGAYSPLIVNLSRQDGSQELNQLTITPPPGLLARLAGIPYCPEAALQAAASKSGRSEERNASCPSASQVGTVDVSAGAGPAPYHASGKAYLAGPYKGAPLSLAILTPAVAGPFDLGTVVVRSALRVNPATAQVTAISDPIPHILQGIPLDVRSVAVKLDHPGWGLNPTSCAPFSFTGSLLSTQGSQTPLYNPFQVGGCADLGFKPKLSLKLNGKTKRGNFPALHAVYRPRQGDANLKGLVLRFPHSEFVEQGHFRTICTRVQYAAGNGGGEQCPPGSVYGHIKAVTPLLDQPLEGPVYLRSSNHNLPDVVFALKGQIDAEAAVRIDSQKGGLRASIEGAPDAPLSEVVLDMQGGAKGLFVNSRDICASVNRASAAFSAHNGRGASGRPVLKAKCKGASRKGQKRRPKR